MKTKTRKMETKTRKMGKLEIDDIKSNYIKLSMNGKIYIIDGTDEESDTISVYNESVESDPQLIHSTERESGKTETISEFEAQYNPEGKRLHPAPWDLFGMTIKEFFTKVNK